MSNIKSSPIVNPDGDDDYYVLRTMMLMYEKHLPMKNQMTGAISIFVSKRKS